MRLQIVNVHEPDAFDHLDGFTLLQYGRARVLWGSFWRKGPRVHDASLTRVQCAASIVRLEGSRLGGRHRSERLLF